MLLSSIELRRYKMFEKFFSSTGAGGVINQFLSRGMCR